MELLIEIIKDLFAFIVLSSWLILIFFILKSGLKRLKTLKNNILNLFN